MDRAGRKLRTIFVAIPCAVMLTTLLLPALNGIVLSFDRHGPSFANYSDLISDPMFWRALINNMLIPLGSLIIEFVFGLAMALMLSSRQKRSGIVEIAAILPFAMPEIVILTLARYIFMPRGYLNGAIESFGLHALPWLSPRSSMAMFTVMLVDAWHVTPIVMLMLLAGLQTIPQELYEAARLDGARTLQTFRFVTLPLLAPAMVGALALRGIDALRIFSTVLILSGPEGVPVLSTYAYSLWSDAQQQRRAMAAAVVLALMVVILGVGGIAVLRRWSGNGEGALA